MTWDEIDWSALERLRARDVTTPEGKAAIARGKAKAERAKAAA